VNVHLHGGRYLGRGDTGLVNRSKCAGVSSVVARGTGSGSDWAGWEGSSASSLVGLEGD